MDTMMAFCGLTCSECPAFVATLEDNNDARETLAVLWSTETFPLTPADIYCDGCTQVGKRLLSFCTGCEIRTCVFEKDLKSCAYCADYPCIRLDKIHPEAKTYLENLRKETRI